MYGPGTGIGPALRKARLHRGKSIEEASRDTKIRAEYLLALEREAFSALHGDVYVRGFLRSYSSYLGLNSDKVVSVYVRATGRTNGEAPEPPPPRGISQPALGKVTRRRGNWTLAVAIAIVGLIVAGAVGILTRGASAPAAVPPDATAEDATEDATVPTDRVTATLTAHRAVPAVVIVDGLQIFAGTLHQGATRWFQGANLIRVKLSEGGAVDLVVNGKAIGAPGEHGEQYAASFQPEAFRASPSAEPSG